MKSELSHELAEMADRGESRGADAVMTAARADLNRSWVGFSPERRRTPGWVVAVGAAALVLVLVGGVALWSALNPGIDAVSDDVVATTVPAPEVTVSTVASPPTTVAETATTAPTPTTQAPVVTVAETEPMDWSRVSLGAVAARGEMTTVIRGGPGLIAGGFASVDGDRVAAVWTSTDGSTWERVPHDAAVFGGEDAHSITGLAAGDTEYVAVGSSGRDGMAWTSVDGYVWERVPQSASFVGEGWVKMTAVTYGPGAYVAVGYESEPDTDYMIDHGVVWVSPDGLTWDRVDSDLFVDQILLDDVAANDSGYVAVGLDWTPTPIHPGVWISEDGRTWDQVDLGDDEGARYMQAVDATEDSIVAAGIYSPDLAMPEEAGDGSVVMWLSENATTWNRVPEDPELIGAPRGAYTYGVTVSGDQIVAVGEFKPKSVASSQAAAWVSNDAGSTWDHIATPAETFGIDANALVIMRDVVVIDGVYVAVGVYDGETAVWNGLWNEEDG